ncbi:SDR family NAD(P)-dependent oxidoreductase [Piscinibacter sp.]|jgi:NAD(P)-dependent dehydrogenase (short-subunit alcohol dehydrogenase family)|uniref:SDR family NAD(P)-dependent oxidoreductase n=1 Tax=Piscinibacter sp. TaxID=1903157 RepID=UPI00355A2370
MGRLQDKVAIVTGAALGIGRASARLMAREGAKVVVADLKLDAAESVAAAIRAEGGRASAVHLDAMDRASIEAMIEHTRSTWGALHVLHNNVGGTDVARDTTLTGMDWSCWDGAINLNLTSTVYACRCAIPLMLASGGGAIVNTTSMVALSGDVRPTAYAAAKGGVISFTRFVATQYGRQGIRCNAIAPGLILTERATPRPQAVLDIFERQTLAKRHGEPEDIAYAALFLASDESLFINGQIIEVDGGVHVHNPTTADLVEWAGRASKGGAT